jgi:hypothetical protein
LISSTLPTTIDSLHRPWGGNHAMASPPLLASTGFCVHGAIPKAQTTGKSQPIVERKSALPQSCMVDNVSTPARRLIPFQKDRRK